MLKKLKQSLESRARRKKFEKMKEQLDPKPRPRPARKCAKK